MNYVIIAISIFFICIAFVVTENNAKYLLSGYNTLSNDERKRVDLKALIAYLRNFFIFLGLTFLLISLTLFNFFGETTAAFFICIYPVIACVYLLVNGQKFYKDTGAK